MGDLLAAYLRVWLFFYSQDSVVIGYIPFHILPRASAFVLYIIPSDMSIGS